MEHIWHIFYHIIPEFLVSPEELVINFSKNSLKIIELITFYGLNPDSLF